MREGSGRHAGGGQRDSLERVLLGGSSDEQLPEGLRDTVRALQELFPGEVVSARPREEEGDDDGSGAPSGSADGIEAMDPSEPFPAARARSAAPSHGSELVTPDDGEPG